MKLILFPMTVLLSVVLVGCETTGLSVREPSGRYATVVTSLYQNHEPRATAPQQVRFPIRLATAQIGELMPSRALLDKLSEQPNLIADVSGLPFPGDQPRHHRSNHESNPEELRLQMEALRKLARELGAEFLMIVGGNIDAFQVKNPAAALDATLVAGAFVPGTRVFTEGKAAATLVDVESGRVLFLVNTELNKSSLSPSFFADSRQTKLRVELRDKLLADLGDEFLRRLAAISAQ